MGVYINPKKKTLSFLKGYKTNIKKNQCLSVLFNHRIIPSSKSFLFKSTNTFVAKVFQTSPQKQLMCKKSPRTCRLFTCRLFEKQCSICNLCKIYFIASYQALPFEYPL